MSVRAGVSAYRGCPTPETEGEAAAAASHRPAESCALGPAGAELQRSLLLEVALQHGLPLAVLAVVGHGACGAAHHLQASRSFMLH